MEVGQRIKHYRENAKLDLQQMSFKTGMTPEDLSQIEAGARPLTHQEIEAIAQALGITVDALFSEPQEEHKESEGQSVLIPMDRLSALLEEMKKI